MQEDVVSQPPDSLFGGHTPVLETCSLKSFHLGWDRSILKNLQVIKFDGYWNGWDPSPVIILGILRACPGVRELTLRNLSDVSESRTTSSSADLIRLPHLKKISLYYSGFNRTLSVLDRISFPALERIDIGYLDDAGQFFDILHRQSLTSLPLQYLRVESVYFSEAKLTRLLQRLPGLHTLELVDAEDLSTELLKVRFSRGCPLDPRLMTMITVGPLRTSGGAAVDLSQDPEPESRGMRNKQGNTPLISRIQAP